MRTAFWLKQEQTQTYLTIIKVAIYCSNDEFSDVIDYYSEHVDNVTQSYTTKWHGKSTVAVYELLRGLWDFIEGGIRIEIYDVADTIHKPLSCNGYKTRIRVTKHKFMS